MKEEIISKDCLTSTNMTENIPALFNRINQAIKTVGLTMAVTEAEADINSVAEYLHIGKEEALLLPLLFEARDLRSLKSEFRISKIEFLYYIEALNSLSYDGFIDFDSASITWTVPNTVISQVLRGEPVNLTDYSQLPAEKVIEKMDQCFPRRFNPCPDDDRQHKVEHIIDRFVQTGHPMFDDVLDPQQNDLQRRSDMTFLLLMVHNARRGGNLFDSAMLLRVAHNIDKRAQKASENLFEQAKQAGMIVEEPESDKEEGQTYYRITRAYAEKHGLALSKEASLEDVQSSGQSLRDMIKSANRRGSDDVQDTVAYTLVEHSSIKENRLYYNEKEKADIERMTHLLDEEYLKKVQTKLAKMGRSGIIYLFYGAPGTGKTETCLQMARQSGRDLCKVDISQIKGSLVGESEKNMRALFKSYNEAIEKAKAEGKPYPILLLNEADSVISRRVHVRYGTDQMMNNMQNILLEEFEKTEGIIICTTNLTNNMDEAFERRFLYKVNFNRPGAEVRSQIWKDKIPDLAEADAEYLGTNFDFSGGEIENVVRKAQIDSIMGDEDITLDKLVELASREHYEKPNEERKHVGFV